MIKLENGKLNIGKNIGSWSKIQDMVEGDLYSITDDENNKITIPVSLVVRLYEGLKSIEERNGKDWKIYCESLFNNKN